MRSILRYIPIGFVFAAVAFAATAAFADGPSTSGGSEPDRGHLNPAATPPELVVDPHVVGDPTDRRPDESVMEYLY